jgi:hypothetical protein
MIFAIENVSGLVAELDEFARPRSDVVVVADAAAAAAAAPAVAAVVTLAEDSVAITPGRNGCITSDSPSTMQHARKKTQNNLKRCIFLLIGPTQLLGVIWGLDSHS